MTQPYRTLVLGAVALIGASVLTACGSPSNAGETASAPAAQPSGSAPAASGGDGQAQFAAIRECLDAAGIDTSKLGPAGGRPSGAPSGAPSGMPSDLPTDLPSGAAPPNGGTPPSGAPSGVPSGGPGGPGGGMFSSPEVQAALEACGITVPSPGQGQ